MRWLACLAGLLIATIATTAMALSMVSPPPTWIRISGAPMATRYGSPRARSRLLAISEFIRYVHWPRGQ